jgi:hypothetical protein
MSMLNCKINMQIAMHTCESGQVSKVGTHAGMVSTDARHGVSIETGQAWSHARCEAALRP